MKGTPILNHNSKEETKMDDLLQYLKDDFENQQILEKALKLVFKPNKTPKKDEIDKNLKRIRQAYTDIELEDGF